MIIKKKLMLLALAIMAVASLAWAGNFYQFYSQYGTSYVNATMNPSHQNFQFYITAAPNSSVAPNNGSWQIRGREYGVGNWTTIATNLGMNSSVIVQNRAWGEISVNASRLDANQTWILNIYAWGL